MRSIILFVLFFVALAGLLTGGVGLMWIGLSWDGTLFVYSVILIVGSIILFRDFLREYS